MEIAIHFWLGEGVRKETKEDNKTKN